ncbi:MAG TPA: OB-fold nucleic acid binding domain-containing protein, partial [Bacillales bacterium]|nr:OB-fold nucleic acid binding domain-containing protein [Bacillales bacterium]
MVVKTRYIRTKKGDPMAFLTLSDDSGEIEVVVFPKLFGRHPTYFEQDRFLLVEGAFQKEEQSANLIARKAVLLDDVHVAGGNRSEGRNRPAGDSGSLFLKIETGRRHPDSMRQLKNVLQRYKGNTQVLVYYEDEGKTLQLPETFNVDPTKECMILLKRHLGANNVVFKK